MTRMSRVTGSQSVRLIRCSRPRQVRRAVSSRYLGRRAREHAIRANRGMVSSSDRVKLVRDHRVRVPRSVHRLAGI